MSTSRSREGSKTSQFGSAPVFGGDIGWSPFPIMMREHSRRPVSLRLGKSRTLTAHFSYRAFWIVLGVTAAHLFDVFSPGFIKLSGDRAALVAIFVYSVCIALLRWCYSLRFLFAMQPGFPAHRSHPGTVPHRYGLLRHSCRGFCPMDRRNWTAVADIGIAYWNRPSIHIVITLAIGMSVSSYETLRYKLQAATLKHARARLEQERAYKFTGRAQLSSLRIAHPHLSLQHAQLHRPH